MVVEINLRRMLKVWVAFEKEQNPGQFYKTAPDVKSVTLRSSKQCFNSGTLRRLKVLIRDYQQISQLNLACRFNVRVKMIFSIEIACSKNVVELRNDQKRLKPNHITKIHKN